jgi:pyruvate formate lyase activating enzyme
MSSQLLKEMVDISLSSGGCIKFDLKTWTEELNIALCGTSNKQTLENFQFISTYIHKRPDPPLLVASTLLVPGYVDIYEIERLAGFICRLSPEIPYSLLAFHPQFQMTDLSTTSRSHAEKARQVALKAGLTNVRIGNIHLLSDAYTV